MQPEWHSVQESQLGGFRQWHDQGSSETLGVERTRRQTFPAEVPDRGSTEMSSCIHAASLTGHGQSAISGGQRNCSQGFCNAAGSPEETVKAVHCCLETCLVFV
jgi:hypothetical protein